MFRFSLLLLIKISKSKLCLRSPHTDTAQQRARLNCICFSLPLPCFAVPAVGVTQCLLFTKALAFDSTPAVETFTASMHGCWLGFATYSFSSLPPFATSVRGMSSCRKQKMNVLITSRSARSLAHAKVTLSCALHSKMLPNPCNLHRSAFG